MNVENFDGLYHFNYAKLMVIYNGNSILKLSKTTSEFVIVSFTAVNTICSKLICYYQKSRKIVHHRMIYSIIEYMFYYANQSSRKTQKNNEHRVTFR